MVEHSPLVQKVTRSKSDSEIWVTFHFRTEKTVSVHPALNGYTWHSSELGKVKRRRGKELATLPHHAVALCAGCKAHPYIMILNSMGLPLPIVQIKLKIVAYTCIFYLIVEQLPHVGRQDPLYRNWIFLYIKDDMCVFFRSRYRWGDESYVGRQYLCYRTWFVEH